MINKIVPEGVVVTEEYLHSQGITNIQKYLKKGKLTQCYKGAYRQPGDILRWECLAYSLTHLGYSYHIGSYTALFPYAHNIVFSFYPIYIYSTLPLPEWVTKLPLKDSPRIIPVQKQALPAHLGVTTIPFGTWDCPIYYSTPERAFLEALESASKQDLEEIDKMFESATTLRPELLYSLLGNCYSKKAKNLFMFLAHRHKHQWYKELKNENF